MPDNPYLIPYRKKNKWGFYSQNKLIAIDCVYNSIRPFKEQFAAVRINTKWNFINSAGESISDREFEEVGDFCYGLARVKVNGKWGYINLGGEVEIECQFQYAYDFSEFLASVKKNGKYGFISPTGQVNIPFQYDGTGGFTEGLAWVSKNGRVGFIDNGGKVVIPFQFNDAHSFSGGLALVGVNKEVEVLRIPQNTKAFESKPYYGFINKVGLITIPCEYSDAKSFSEEVAFVFINDGERFGEYSIDATGKILNRSCYYSNYGFSEGLRPVVYKNKWGFIDKKEDVVIPFQYDNIISGFIEGLAAIGDRGYYDEPFLKGFIDKNGFEYWES